MKLIQDVTKILCSFILFSIVTGCGGGGGAPLRDTTPPQINNVTVSPATLRFTGGVVTIHAYVNDDSGVMAVWAVVTKPDGSTEQVNMNTVDGRYQCTYQASANVRNDGQAEVYVARIRAYDNNGNTTPEPGEPSNGVEFKVNAPEKPPSKPAL